MRSPTLPRLTSFLALLSLVVAGNAAANTFCVSNAGALQLALNAVSDGGAWGLEANTIRVVAGTYSIGTLSNQTFHYVNTSSSGSLNLQGGWNVGCTARTQQAALTVLDGNNANQVLNLRQVANELDVTSFTIQNGNTTLMGGGVSMNAVSGDNSRVVLVGNIIRNNHTTDGDGGVFASSGTSDLIFANNVVVNNSADNGDGGGSLIGISNVLTVRNSTIAFNTTIKPGALGGLFVNSGSGNGFVTRSIFWGNSNCGIYIGGGNERLDENDFGSRCGQTPLTEIGNLNVVPQFVDAAGGDFHLASNSPLIGTTAGYTTQFDPDGHQGPAHGVSDRGAYFETVFADGVEGN